MRGYNSGVMPVDSGMKDIELPCLGFGEYKTSKGHEILRKQLEELVSDNDLEDIIIENGYKELIIPDYKNATWWTHLVLIYFKRYYCNKHNPENCPLKNKIEIKEKCTEYNKD